MKTRIETVIFDYGNTLVLDPFLQILRIKSNDFRQLLEANACRVGWQRFVQSWIEANNEIDLPFVSHFYQEETIVEQVLKEVGICMKDISNIVREILGIYRQGFEKVLTTDHRRIEVSQTLEFLKNRGFKLAILSNERKFALDIALRFYGIIGFFDLILSSERVGVEKPNAKVFYDALEALEAKPKTTAYVGDDPIRDVLPGKKIGMATILYIPPPEYSHEASWRSYEHPRTKPDFVIRKFDELKQII